MRGKSIAQRLQQADDAIEDSEEEFHKTLQLLSMERLLRLAAAKGQPAEPDAARLMQPTWAEFQLPSLPQQVDARDREVRRLLACCRAAGYLHACRDTDATLLLSMRGLRAQGSALSGAQLCAQDWFPLRHGQAMREFALLSSR